MPYVKFESVIDFTKYNKIDTTLYCKSSECNNVIVGIDGSIYQSKKDNQLFYLSRKDNMTSADYCKNCVEAYNTKILVIVGILVILSVAIYYLFEEIK